jgi:NAD(P)H dehydrogenase (quinone)
VLTNPGHENKTYELTGSQAYDFNDITSALSNLSGKSLSYVSPDPTVFETQLKQFGVPEMGITIAAGFATDIRNGRFETVSNDLETLLGRKPSDLKQGLKQVYQL